ncbi:cutinase family protein [Actinomycetospora atypica]|uniref:Cutinase family protein n=1 Tax=Actinomycetospora atypica TaxID=1290095 RepID=A0ABV9YN92_9PSEU
MGAADVQLEVVRASGGVTVLADGRELPVGGRDPHEVALAAARRHAARRGRVLRVELVDGDTTVLEVTPDGAVRSVPTTPPGATGRQVAPNDHIPTMLRVDSSGPVVPRSETPVDAPASSSWRRPAPERVAAGRPLSSLVVAALVMVAVLVGAVGTGVATLASSQALPDSCRPVTLYSVGGSGAGSEVLTGVTDPLAQQFGEKVSVVTVPPPAAGGSYAQAESAAVDALSAAIGDHVEGCPSGAIMLFGYSEGAQVAGDLASRIGTGQEQRIPAGQVQAVGLFGDPARSPRTRAVPEGTTGQGVLPPRAVGFGALDARTIEICAPGDPVCDSPATAAFPSLEQALGSPVHASYAELPIAQGTTAPQWAVGSLGKVVAAVPNDAGPGTAVPGTPSAEARPTTTAPGGPAAQPGGSTTYAEQPGGPDAQPEGSTTYVEQPGGPEAQPEGSTTYAEQPGVASTISAPPDAGTDADTGADAAPTRGGDLTTGAAEPTGTAAPTGSGGSARSNGSTRSAAPTTSVAPTTGAAPGGTATRRGASVTPTVPPGSGASEGTDGRRSTTRATEAPGAEEDPATTSAGSTSRRAPSAGSTTSGRAPATTTAPEDDGGSAGTDTDAAFSLTDGLEGFKSTPWNNQNATDPSGAESPNVPGREAVRFEMPGGGKRTEAEPDVPEFQEGETKFVGYSGFFDQGFPTDTGTWQLIMQFKQPGTGSPPLAVEVGNGQLRLANNGGNQKDFCPVGPGAFSFQLGITFGGTIDAYCNGKQTLSGYRTPESNVKGSAYLKTGIYRDESIGQDSTLFLNDLKIGDDLAAVSGLAGAPSGSGPATTDRADDGDTGRTADDAASRPATADEPPSTASRRPGSGADPASAPRPRTATTTPRS